MSNNIFYQLIKILKIARGDGKPVVCEEAGNLSLYFGVGTTQSRMKMSDPYRLMLGYTRTMMGFLLFNGSGR